MLALISSFLHPSVSLPLSWFLSGRFHLTWCFSPPQVFSSSSAFSLWIRVIGFCASSSSSHPSFHQPYLFFLKTDAVLKGFIWSMCWWIDQLRVSRCFVGFFPLFLYLCVLPRSLSGSHRGVPLQSLPRPFFVPSAFLLSLPPTVVFRTKNEKCTNFCTTLAWFQNITGR